MRDHLFGSVGTGAVTLGGLTPKQQADMQSTMFDTYAKATIGKALAPPVPQIPVGLQATPGDESL